MAVIKSNAFLISSPSEEILKSEINRWKIIGHSIHNVFSGPRSYEMHIRIWGSDWLHHYLHYSQFIPNLVQMNYSTD